MEALCDRLVGNSQIRSIALVNCDITSINPFRLLNHTAFQNLRSLNLSRNQIVTLLPLANLALPNLQDLNLCNFLNLFRKQRHIEFGSVGEVQLPSPPNPQSILEQIQQDRCH